MSDQRGHRQRLKTRWLQAGSKALADHELLELLLCYAIPQKDLKPLAKNLIKRFGSLEKVLQAPRETLSSEKGLGEHSAILIDLLQHLSRRIQSEEWDVTGKKIAEPMDLKDYLITHLGNRKEEFFYLILLDQQNRIITGIELEHGIENRAQVYIKKVVRHCLDRHATAIICAHNHPSGRRSFSSSDIELTKTLAAALTPMEIRLLDHLLVCKTSLLSLVAEGHWPT